MNSSLKILAAIATVLISNAASASPELARAKTCTACHSMDRRLVGPSFQEIAGKHAGQAGAVDQLAGRIVKGSTGVWGPVPMPANPQVSEAEAKQLAEWILGAK